MTNSSIGNNKSTIEAGFWSSVNLLTSVQFECYAVLIPRGVLQKISTSLNGLVSYYPP